jgi:hypothetical protein
MNRGPRDLRYIAKSPRTFNSNRRAFLLPVTPVHFVPSPNTQLPATFQYYPNPHSIYPLPHFSPSLISPLKKNNATPPHHLNAVLPHQLNPTSHSLVSERGTKLTNFIPPHLAIYYSLYVAFAFPAVATCNKRDKD